MATPVSLRATLWSTAEVRSVAGALELHRVVRGQPAVGESLEALDVRAVSVGGGPVAQDVTAIEGAGVVGDAAWGGHRLGGSRDVRLERLAGHPAIQQGGHLVTAEAELGRPSAPLVTQSVGRDVVGLGAAGLQRRDLRRPRRAAAVAGHVLTDLLPAGREVAHHLLRDAVDLRDTVGDGEPPHADAFDELCPKGCLVEEPGGPGVGVERLAVEGGRAPGCPGRVGDDRVGVQVGVAGSGGAMAEGRDGEPFAREAVPASASAARPGGVAFDVVEGLSDGFVVRIAELRGEGLVADAEEDGDGLRCGEGEVVAQDGLAVGRVGLQRAEELVVADNAREALLGGAGPVPAAWRLSGSGVVVLGALGDRLDVVRGVRLAAADLPDAEHAP